MDCSVCLEPLSDPITETPCAHCFHRACISRWIFNRARRNEPLSCPICRIDFRLRRANAFLRRCPSEIQRAWDDEFEHQVTLHPSADMDTIAVRVGVALRDTSAMQYVREHELLRARAIHEWRTMWQETMGCLRRPARRGRESPPMYVSD